MSGYTGAVALFLRDLPPETSCRDLRAFVRTGLHEVGVQGMPRLGPCSSCQIIRLTDPAAGTVEYHGLIEIRPARIAIQAIRILNGRELKGRPIAVRRYRQRSPWGEHRLHRAGADGPNAVVARPLVERRREHLKVDLVEATPPLRHADTTRLAPPVPV